MNQKMKRQMILNTSYAALGLSTTNFGGAWRIPEGMNASGRLWSVIPNGGFQQALSSPLPSLYPLGLTVGICCTLALRLAVYLKGKNAKRLRHNEEYGSARWGAHADIELYEGLVLGNNVILPLSERPTMNSRPKNLKYTRNRDVLVIDGSGPGRTRFVFEPNLLQMHSFYMITDPKGAMLDECGKASQTGPVKKGSEGKPMKSRSGRSIYDPYHIRIFNTINFKRSIHYSPFACIHNERDILKLAMTLIVNTEGDGKVGDGLWTSTTCPLAVKSWWTHDYGRADN